MPAYVAGMGERVLTTANRYETAVNALCQACMNGSTTYKDAARRLHPTVVILTHMRLTGTTQERLAAQLGVTQATVSRMLDGTHVPNKNLRATLQKVCLIPAEQWDRQWKAA